ncbi:alkyl hydroperoxide reductase [Acuticoccus sediminis]|uniref:Alkyl hydroperoxide reductase n=1 Tax=Acuticoccus sediminis TaxID=2184697 RepID=A0A8B2P1T9_9HYPH|nr:peroxiredoxin-like family protein [Acuticoccus sediminis]RAI03924.1 alkyl hydroperoxide reductase [Acuticoccus sediminis]
MSDLKALMPRDIVPAITADLVGGGTWSSAAPGGDPFTLVVFYRGLHCPICKTYLGTLEKLLPEFAKRGVKVVALSSDSAERAATAKEDWRLPEMTIGTVSLEAARSWGLYVSTSRGVTSIGIEEPALFSEPGIFILRPDSSLYFVSTQSMPFARPRFEEMLQAIDFVVAKDYPARGQVASLAEAAVA